MCKLLVSPVDLDMESGIDYQLIHVDKSSDLSLFILI